MTTFDEVKAELLDEVCKDTEYNDGCLSEANGTINDLNRQLIAAMRREKGAAWLGHINLYDWEEKGKADIIKEWDGTSLVYNFGCCFVAPVYDDELAEMIWQRHNAQYTGTGADSVRIDAIFARIKAIGGESLLWT